MRTRYQRESAHYDGPGKRSIERRSRYQPVRHSRGHYDDQWKHHDVRRTRREHIWENHADASRQRCSGFEPRPDAWPGSERRQCGHRTWNWRLPGRRWRQRRHRDPSDWRPASHRHRAVGRDSRSYHHFLQCGLVPARRIDGLFGEPDSDQRSVDSVHAGVPRSGYQVLRWLKHGNPCRIEGCPCRRDIESWWCCHI